MTDFMDKLNKTLESADNISITENGAIGYKTTGSELVDLNFKASSLRNTDKEEAYKMFEKAYAENDILALKWLFYLRDVRGGMGERDTFRNFIKREAADNPDVIRPLVRYIPEYGRWDDLFVLFGTPVEDEMIKVIKATLSLKDEAFEAHTLGKWMPSENTSSKETREFGHKMRKALGLSPKAYRKLLTGLRAGSVVEVKMTAKQWGEIDYSKVPSRAMANYKKAFEKHDEARFSEFAKKAEKGEAVIHSDTLFPHEIYAKIAHGCLTETSKSVVEAQWKALPSPAEDIGSTIVVVDDSGSMDDEAVAGSNNIYNIDVSRGLGIYFGERCKGCYKDKYIEFSSKPNYVDFSKCETLEKKVRVAMRYDDCSNTDVKAVFDLILKTAVENKIDQNDLPKTILVISDMEFDQGMSSGYSAYANRYKPGSKDMSLMKEIQDEYESFGYKLPRMVYWNVGGRTGTIPMIQNDLGVVLVSGYSQNSVKMFMNGEENPEKALAKVLASERYAPITIVKAKNK